MEIPATMFDKLNPGYSSQHYGPFITFDCRDTTHQR
ncbi:hypothetical protein PR003_g4423 [Phytophthora rubi]|uniref:Uncharacterized protein n=1 Tax=Phytophthora rubi TaxID=129364 RepID=A0A6A4FMD4_9STRA|nr:hypothetical protein PR003_g4423 [Phytophthora rubi]